MINVDNNAYVYYTGKCLTITKSMMITIQSKHGKKFRRLLSNLKSTLIKVMDATYWIRIIFE